jgi:hypothetical protein
MRKLMMEIQRIKILRNTQHIIQTTVVADPNSPDKLINPVSSAKTKKVKAQFSMMLYL